MAEEMGYCDVVEAIEIGSNRTTVFRQEEEASRTVSIVIRGGTLNLLDDIERAIDDGVNVVKSMTKVGHCVFHRGTRPLRHTDTPAPTDTHASVLGWPFGHWRWCGRD